MKVIAAIVLATTALVLAEPPVPNNQFGPPNNQYIPPNNQYIPPGPPPNQYGPPTHTTAVIKPNNQYGPPSRPGNGYLPPGQGNGNGGYDDQSEPANYNFEYHVEDAASGNDFGHEESRQGDVAQGKYFVLLPDGRRQVVEYTADSEGYKPKISYEQVGNGNNGGYPPSNGGYPPSNGGYPPANGGYPPTNGGYPPSNGGHNGGNGGNGGYQY